MSLASWWLRTSTRWLGDWLERKRRDPDVSLADFKACERAFEEHLEWCDEQDRKSEQARLAAHKSRGLRAWIQHWHWSPSMNIILSAISMTAAGYVVWTVAKSLLEFIESTGLVHFFG